MNKYLEYHKKLEWDSVTAEVYREFPVHFGFIDAVISADGAFGFRGDKTPESTNTVIGGRDLIAVDWVGARKMGLDPTDSVVMARIVAVAVGSK